MGKRAVVALILLAAACVAPAVSGPALAGTAESPAVVSVSAGSGPAPAISMRATTYDDGLSCPGNCDAHVVYHPSRRGTRNAFLPAAPGQPLLANRADPARAACVSGQQCVICFEESDASCIVALYRGAGPHRDAFDFTPAFIRERCDDPSLPRPLAARCAETRRVADQLARRLNCIANPDLPACAPIMTAATAAKSRDEPEYARCKSLGVAAYNRQQPDPMLHRSPSAGCEYFLNQRGKNSAGATWAKLTPAACAPGYFVGPSGTDCCSADPLQASIDFSECRQFYR